MAASVAAASDEPQLQEEVWALSLPTPTIAYVVRPVGDGPFPLAIMNHGVALDPVQRSFFPLVEFGDAAMWFARRGYMVVAPSGPGYGAAALDVPEAGLFTVFFSKVGHCSNPNFRDAGLHAQEVECIGKSLPPRRRGQGAPALRVRRQGLGRHDAGARQRQPVRSHVKALPGNPYDGHTLATVIPEMEALIGNTLKRILADKGYSGYNAPPDYQFRVFTSGKKRRVTPKIKRELRRRSAVEPVIGHIKSEHRMGRNYLWHRQGDAANAVLAAVGYNIRRLIRWLSLLLRQILAQFTVRLQLVPG